MVTDGNGRSRERLVGRVQTRNSPLEEVIVTDTVPLRAGTEGQQRVRQLAVAPLFTAAQHLRRNLDQSFVCVI